MYLIENQMVVPLLSSSLWVCMQEHTFYTSKTGEAEVICI